MPAHCSPVTKRITTGGRSPDAAYWRQLSVHCLLEALTAPTLTRTEFWHTGFNRCEAALAMIATTEKYSIDLNR